MKRYVTRVISEKLNPSGSNKNSNIKTNNTVKAFVVTSLMTKNSIIFIGGYDKGYKNFRADEILLVCILIYFNKNIQFFGELLKNVRIIK